jgi:hypothetical protein
MPGEYKVLTRKESHTVLWYGLLNHVKLFSPYSFDKRLLAGQLLILLASTVSNLAYSQQLPDAPDVSRFQYAITERLPKANLQFLFEDSRELIWGYDHAEKKLFLFDGLDFTYIDPIQDGDLGCQENSFPYKIFEHQDGKLWILYSCGLYIYDVHTNTMKMLNQELKEASQKPVLHLYNMSKGLDGKVHLATQTGVFEYAPATESFEYFDFGKNTSLKGLLIYIAFENRQGDFFYTNSQEILVQSDIRDTVFEKLPFMIPLAYPPYGSYIALPNYVIFRGNGLVNGKEVNNSKDFRFVKFDHRSRKFSLLQDDYPEFPAFTRMYQYGESVLSIDSLGNLYEYDGKKDSFIPLFNVFDFIPKTYPINDLRVFKKLGQDIVWIMTESSTYKLYPSPVKFSTKDGPPTDRASASPLYFRPGLVKYQGKVYFKTLPRLLPVRDTSVPPIEINSIPVDFNSIGIARFIESPGHGLFGILSHREPTAEKAAPWKQSYYVWTKDLAGNESYRIHPSPPQSPSDYRGGTLMMSIAAGVNGDIWVGSWAGMLNKLSFQEKIVTSSIDTRDSIGRFASGVRRVLVDHQGLVWVAYHSNGIEVFDSTQAYRFAYDQNGRHSLSSDYITALYEDDQGRMWVGTQRGLNCISADRTAIAHYFTHDGLFENTICAVLSDKHGQIWVLTPNATSRFSPGKNRFFSYKLSESPLLEPFKYYAVDQEGYFYHELPQGVFYFHPDSVQTLDKTPLLYVKNMLVNNARLDDHFFSFSAGLE